MWVATLALRQQTRTVRFSTAAEMLDFFRLFKDGKRYQRIMEGFQRIFAATIFFGTNDQPDGKVLLDWARCHFFDRLHLWFHHGEPTQPGASGTENLVVLSDAFYDEIDQHRIPVEREVVALLANAPGVLDLYLWLVWRTTLNGQSVRIPLFGTGGLWDQLGTGSIRPIASFDERSSDGLTKSRPCGLSARPISQKTARVLFSTPPRRTQPWLRCRTLDRAGGSG